MNLWILSILFFTLTSAEKIPDLLKEFGYPMKVYNVFTPDGFRLQLYRIPNGKNVTVTRKGSILFAHSLFSSGSQWLLFEESKAMAFIAANSGYDVWLYNARGTSYSSFHKKYDIDSKEYWDFSWHEIGAIDLPTVIDYILKKTGDETLTYVGYSQGGTAGLVLLSTLPEYNKKVNHAFLIGASAFIGSMTMFAKIYAPLAGLPSRLGIYGINPDLPMLDVILELLCGSAFPTVKICFFFLSLTIGTHTGNLQDVDFFPETIKKVADRISFKQLEHYAQISLSGKFQQFDYGAWENEEKYGSKEPPSYNLSAITSPVTVIHGTYDAIVKPDGSKRLIKKLKNSIGSFEVPYNHIGLLCARDVDVLINKKIIKMLEEKKKDKP